MSSRSTRPGYGHPIEAVQVRQIGVDGIDESGVERHRHAQVGERAVALEIWFERRLRADTGIAEIVRIERVGRERHVADAGEFP